MPLPRCSSARFWRSSSNRCWSAGGSAGHGRKTPAFAACEALSFAFVAVCVHEAITVLRRGQSLERTGERESGESGIDGAAMGGDSVLHHHRVDGDARTDMADVDAGVLAVIASYLTAGGLRMGSARAADERDSGTADSVCGMRDRPRAMDVTTFRRCARATATTQSR